MKVTKNKLKAIINEELQAELNEGMLDDMFKNLADKIFKWLTGTTAGQKTLERANAHIARIDRSGVFGVDSPYRRIPK